MGTGYAELLVITALCVSVPFVFTVLLAGWVANSIRSAVSDAIYKLSLDGRTAPEILDERHARGEIGREEYERVRRDRAGWGMPRATERLWGTQPP